MEKIMWTWSKSMENLQNDYFDNLLFETREEAIEDAKQSVAPEEETVFIEKCIAVPLCNEIDAFWILNDLNGQYRWDTGCDTSYIYDGITQEEKEWLEAEISKVIDRFHEKAKIEPYWRNCESAEVVNIREEE